VKTGRSRRRRRESPTEDEDDDDDVERDVADALTKFWEQRLKIWRDGNDTAQSHTADKVSH